MAIYVYGLMRAPDGARAAAQESEAGPQLGTVEHEGLCALVCEVPEGDVALRRESALAHADTLQEAFRHGPVLPVRFGTVLPDEAALTRDLLAPRAVAFLRRLDALDGLAEMQVKANYLEEPLLRSILAESRELAAAAARIRERPAAATHFDRVALGEAISNRVQARRQSDSERLVGELHEFAVAVNLREVNHERGVLNAAFLLTTQNLNEFDAAVQRLSDEHASEMQFKLIGPMPAHSFADEPWEDRVAGTGRP